MPADVMDRWFRSKRKALLEQQLLRPIPHAQLNDLPLSVQRGQAEVFFLKAEDGSLWILKHFHQGRCPERCYLVAVANLLPRTKGFECGTQRCLLSPQSLVRRAGCHYNADLAQWLDGTVLMPCVNGVDWAAMADDIRSGNVNLDSQQRLTLCRNLSALIGEMEAKQCCHRDLSSGNVFIEPISLSVALIDFDSLFHPSLTMPVMTTGGTSGYTPPYAWSNGSPKPRASWKPCADRFSLALLNVEFLTLSKNAPLSSEGGMFNQDELGARSGATIQLAEDVLKVNFPTAVGMFNTALRSNDYGQCPSPRDWAQLAQGSVQPRTRAPSLQDLESVNSGFFANVLSSGRSTAPKWAVPSLAQLPSPHMQVPRRVVACSLPQDPWGVSQTTSNRK